MAHCIAQPGWTSEEDLKRVETREDLPTYLKGTVVHLFDQQLKSAVRDHAAGDSLISEMVEHFQNVTQGGRPDGIKPLAISTVDNRGVRINDAERLITGMYESNAGMQWSMSEFVRSVLYDEYKMDRFLSVFGTYFIDAAVARFTDLRRYGDNLAMDRWETTPIVLNTSAMLEPAQFLSDQRSTTQVGVVYTRAGVAAAMDWMFDKTKTERLEEELATLGVSITMTKGYRLLTYLMMKASEYWAKWLSKLLPHTTINQHTGFLNRIADRMFAIDKTPGAGYIGLENDAIAAGTQVRAGYNTVFVPELALAHITVWNPSAQLNDMRGPSFALRGEAGEPTKPLPDVKFVQKSPRGIEIIESMRFPRQRGLGSVDPLQSKISFGLYVPMTLENFRNSGSSNVNADFFHPDMLSVRLVDGDRHQLVRMDIWPVLEKAGVWETGAVRKPTEYARPMFDVLCFGRSDETLTDGGDGAGRGFCDDAPFFGLPPDQLPAYSSGQTQLHLSKSGLTDQTLLEKALFGEIKAEDDMGDGFRRDVNFWSMFRQQKLLDRVVKRLMCDPKLYRRLCRELNAQVLTSKALPSIISTEAAMNALTGTSGPLLRPAFASAQAGGNQYINDMGSDRSRRLQALVALRDARQRELSEHETLYRQTQAAAARGTRPDHFLGQLVADELEQKRGGGVHGDVKTSLVGLATESKSPAAPVSIDGDTGGLGRIVLCVHPTTGEVVSIQRALEKNPLEQYAALIEKVLSSNHVLHGTGAQGSGWALFSKLVLGTGDDRKHFMNVHHSTGTGEPVAHMRDVALLTSVLVLLRMMHRAANGVNDASYRGPRFGDLFTFLAAVHVRPEFKTAIDKAVAKGNVDVTFAAIAQDIQQTVDAALAATNDPHGFINGRHVVHGAPAPISVADHLRVTVHRIVKRLEESSGLAVPVAHAVDTLWTDHGTPTFLAALFEMQSAATLAARPKTHVSMLTSAARLQFVAALFVAHAANAGEDGPRQSHLFRKVMRYWLDPTVATNSADRVAWGIIHEVVDKLKVIQIGTPHEQSAARNIVKAQIDSLLNQADKLLSASDRGEIASSRRVQRHKAAKRQRASAAKYGMAGRDVDGDASMDTYCGDDGECEEDEDECDGEDDKGAGGGSRPRKSKQARISEAHAHALLYQLRLTHKAFKIFHDEKVPLTVGALLNMGFTKWQTGSLIWVVRGDSTLLQLEDEATVTSTHDTKLFIAYWDVRYKSGFVPRREENIYLSPCATSHRYIGGANTVLFDISRHLDALRLGQAVEAGTFAMLVPATYKRTGWTVLDASGRYHEKLCSSADTTALGAPLREPQHPMAMIYADMFGFENTPATPTMFTQEFLQSQDEPLASQYLSWPASFYAATLGPDDRIEIENLIKAMSPLGRHIYEDTFARLNEETAFGGATQAFGEAAYTRYGSNET